MLDPTAEDWRDYRTLWRKHHGETLGAVVDDDPEYVLWLWDNVRKSEREQWALACAIEELTSGC